MLYKAALKDTTTTASAESVEEVDGSSTANTNGPHPYFMALGVLTIQKVVVENVIAGVMFLISIDITVLE